MAQKWPKRLKRDPGTRPTGKIYMLTYAQTGQLGREYFATCLKMIEAETDSLENIIVSEERHKDGNYHYHCLVMFDKDRELSTNHFDIPMQDIFLHPNVSIIKRKYLEHAFSYFFKEDSRPFILNERRIANFMEDHKKLHRPLIKYYLAQGLHPAQIIEKLDILGFYNPSSIYRVRYETEVAQHFARLMAKKPLKPIDITCLMRGQKPLNVLYRALRELEY